MEAEMEERRRHPRHQPSSDITGKVKSTMEFRVVDISEGGVQVETRLGLPPATVCELKVSSFGSDFVLKAKVRRCRAQLTKTDAGCKVAYRSGLEFVDVDQDRQVTIQQLICHYCPENEAQDGPVAVTQGAVISGSLYSV
jgi:c-di-GMP-binding flagellar brake protein YcgR